MSDVFSSSDGEGRLGVRLREARALGAEIAVLPELPLDAWAPATDQPSDEDAEPPDGRRQQALARAARSSPTRPPENGGARPSSTTQAGGSSAATRSSTCPRNPASGRPATTSQ